MKQSWGRRARHDRVTELIHLEADLLGYRHLYYTLAITFIVKHQQEIQEIPDTRDLDVHQENTCIYEKEKENDRIYKSQVNDCIYKPTCNNYNC